jgi:Protein of unknown function (DUF3617)
MRPVVIALTILFSLGVRGEEKFHPLNVKPGLWETTMTKTTTGQLPLPPDALARLTPEQRAKVEERMRANSAPHTTTETRKSCETKQKLAEAPFSDEEKGCTRTIVTSSSSKVEAKFACDRVGMKTTGTMTVQALSSENVKGSAHISMNTNGHSTDLNATFTSKWLGASCGNVK